MSLLSVIKSLFGFKNGHNPADRQLICEDCHQQFVFDEGEQRFFRQKGFTDPKRCPRCRKKVKFKMRKNFKKRGSHNHRHRKHELIDGDSPYADER